MKTANSWVSYTLKFSSHNPDIGVIVRNSFQDVLLTVKEDVVLDRSDDGKVQLGFHMDENGVHLYVNGIKSMSSCPISILNGWEDSLCDEENLNIVMETKTPRHENHVSMLGVFYDTSGSPIRALLRKMSRSKYFQNHIHAHALRRSKDNSAVNLNDTSHGNKHYPNSNSTFRLVRNIVRPHMKFDYLHKNTADIIEGEVIMCRSLRKCRYDIVKCNGYFNSGIHYWETLIKGDLKNIELHFGVISVDKEKGSTVTNYLEAQDKQTLEQKIQKFWDNTERKNSIVFSKHGNIIQVAKGHVKTYKPNGAVDGSEQIQQPDENSKKSVSEDTEVASQADGEIDHTSVAANLSDEEGVGMIIIKEKG